MDAYLEVTPILVGHPQKTINQQKEDSETLYCGPSTMLRKFKFLNAQIKSMRFAISKTDYAYSGVGTSLQLIQMALESFKPTEELMKLPMIVKILILS